MSRKAAHDDGRTQRAVSRIKTTLSRLTISAVLALAFVTLVLAGFAGAPYFFKATTIENEIANQLRATTGLAFSSESAGRFTLFPRPRVELGAVHVTDPNGTLAIDADALEGDVRLLPLIVGRIELVSAALTRPYLTIDLDGRPMPADSLVGRAMRPNGAALQEDGARRLGIVTLSGGTAVLKSAARAQLARFTDVNVTLDWRDLDSPATLTGSLRARGVQTDVAAWVAQPAALMRGDHSAMSLHVHAAPFDLSGSGDLVSGDTTAFRGRLTASAGSIPALLRLAGDDFALPAPFANVSLESDATISIDAQAVPAFNLQNLTMHADGNELEGAVAFQGGDRPSLSGTLASEQLSLAPFLSRLPRPFDAGHRWTTLPILDKPPHPLDLDLRLSATHLRVAQYAIDGAALAVITRGDRTEITLADGKAYGGTLKGRCSIGIADTSVAVHATASLVDADAATLSWDSTGRQLTSGTVSASLNLDTSGTTVAELVSRLHGSVKGSSFDGEISGIDFARAVKEAANPKGIVFLSALRSGHTSFDKATLTTQIVDGVATIDSGTIEGKETDLGLGGSVDIGARSIGLTLVAKPSTAPSSEKVAPLRLEIGGTFDKPTLTPRNNEAPTTAPSKSP